MRGEEEMKVRMEAEVEIDLPPIPPNLEQPGMCIPIEAMRPLN